MWIEDKRTAWEAPARHLNGKLFYIYYILLLCSSLDAAAGRSRVRWFLAAVVRNCWDRLSQLWKDIVPAISRNVDEGCSWWFCFFAPFVLPMRRILFLLFPVHEVYEEFVVASTVWWRYVVLKAGMELKVEAVPCCVKAHAWQKLLDSIG